MTNTTELANVDTNTGEILDNYSNEKVVNETEDFVVVQGADGKFVRRAKYNNYSSFVAESREDKLWLLNIMEADDETGNALSNNIGKTIEVQDIIIRKYDRINEDTGAMEYGVLTYLITPKREAFVTSSKTVYFSITRIMELFGKPHEEGWVNVKVKVGSEKGANGTIVKIKMVG